MWPWQRLIGFGPVFWQRLTIGIVASWMLVGMVWFSLWDHYVRTRPTEMQIASGRVIPLSSHGRCVYLTERERRRLSILYHSVEGFAASFLLLLLLNRITSKPPAGTEASHPDGSPHPK